jgi:uroporphyrinogen-III synthase
MLDHYALWYKNRTIKPPLLFLVGETRRDIIPKTLMNPELPEEKRIKVDELEIYGTGVMESFENDFRRILVGTEKRRDRWTVVFSPTGCEAMLRVLGYLDETTGQVIKKLGHGGEKETFVITIGPTTRDYLKDTFGFEPDVCAERPSPEGLLDGICRFMEEKIQGG